MQFEASVLLEENIFDHNGWYVQQPDNTNNNSEGGQATMFNHNTYFSDSSDTISRRNIFFAIKYASKMDCKLSV